MEIKDMNMEELEARKLEIREKAAEASAEELTAMNEELDQIEERQKALEDIAEKRSAMIERVSAGAGRTIREFAPATEETTVEKTVEMRNSKAYIDAYAEYVKTGNDTEVRTLFSENAANGTIAVPDFVYDIVKTAWEKSEIMSLVRKTELKGNLKVNFEVSSTGAVTHKEGGTAVEEEQLVEGIVKIVPEMRKKWIAISREVYAMRGEDFLRYIYDEIAHHIVKKIENDLIAMIAELPDTATTESPSAAVVQGDPHIGIIAEAIAHLSDEATNPVVVMNKLTWAKFKNIQYAAQYPIDPFEGMTVYFNNRLPAYGSEADTVYAIVGDFGQGALATYPEGEGVDFIFDEFSRKKEDLIEILGQEFVGLGVVADKAFTLIKTPSGN